MTSTRRRSWADLSATYRAPLRSRDDTVDHAAAVSWALARGVVAVGGRLGEVPCSLSEAVAAVAREHGSRVADRLERFAAVPVGSTMWTRHPDGDLWVGVVTGRWSFDDSPDAAAFDLQHTRPCEWSEEPVSPGRAPAAVLETFARGGRNFQRIRRL